MKLKRIISLIGLVLLGLGLGAVKAGQILQTPSLIITIDDETGDISRIAAKSQREGASKSVDLLVDGNLLSLDWLIQPNLLGNRIVKDDIGKSVIESRYVNQGLTILRQVSGGMSPYALSIRYEITNTSREVVELASILDPTFHFAEGFNEFVDEGGGYGAWVYAYRDIFVSNKAGAKRLDSEELKEFSTTEPIQWLGWVNRHYVMAIRLHPPRSIGIGVEETFSNIENADKELMPASLVLTFAQANQAPPEQLMPGESTTIAFDSVIAPKQWDQLSLVTPALDSVVLLNLWDWFRWICFAIWQLLNFLFGLSGSWGVAIILMALMVRILIIPVTRISLQYQERAIQQQEKIKPLIKRVKEEYKGIELSEQLVSLYEREKYDQLAPLKGMLGLFIQIPILIALFNVLGEAPELSGVPFLWFNDLALSDRLFPLGVDVPFFGAYFNLLPFLMAGITVLSTYYAARVDSNNTSTSGLFGMAALFFILFYSFPSALVLYWLCSVCFQLLQQVIENRLK